MNVNVNVNVNMANYFVVYYITDSSTNNNGIIGYGLDKDVFFNHLKSVCDALEIKNLIERKYYVLKKSNMILYHNMTDEKELLYIDTIHDAKSTDNALCLSYERAQIPIHKMPSSFEYDDEHVLNRCSFKLHKNDTKTSHAYLRFDECRYKDGKSVYSISCTCDGPDPREEQMLEVLGYVILNNDKKIVEHCKR